MTEKNIGTVVICQKRIIIEHTFWFLRFDKFEADRMRAGARASKKL